MDSAVSTRQIWRVAYPIILGSIAQNILIVTDTAFLGNLGEVALGGGVIGSLFYQVLLMFGWGISIGGQIIIARRYGEGSFKSIGKIVDHLFYSLIILGLVLMLLFGIFSGTFYNMMVESDAVRQTGKDFFNCRLLGLVIAFICYTFQSFYVGVAKTKVITLSTITMVITNIVLDYALMFGHWGFPQMGVSGAALASVIAECVGATTFILYTFLKYSYKDYNLMKFSRLEFSIIGKIFKIGWPLMLEFSLSVFVWFIFFLFIEKMGQTELAISNIVRSLYNVIIIPVWGYASATNTFVSQMIGKGRSDEVMKVIYKILKLSLLSVFVLSAIFLFFGRFVMLIYTNDVQLIDQTIRVMYVVEVAALGMGCAYALFNGVSGTGNTFVSFCIEMVALVFHLLWSYLMAIEFKQPLAVVWMSEIIYSSLTIILSLWYLKSKRWMGRNI